MINQEISGAGSVGHLVQHELKTEARVKPEVEGLATCCALQQGRIDTEGDVRSAGDDQSVRAFANQPVVLCRPRLKIRSYPRSGPMDRPAWRIQE
jgi:hypothetical protein